MYFVFIKQESYICNEKFLLFYLFILPDSWKSVFANNLKIIITKITSRAMFLYGVQ